MRQFATSLFDYCQNNPSLIHLLDEWIDKRNQPLLPSDVSRNSHKEVWWKCSLGHEWQARIEGRTRGNGCSYCSGLKALPGFNDLQTTNPNIASEWHPSKNNGLLPSQVLPKSDKEVWWLCSNGHDWQAPVKRRTRGQGCPYCSGRLAINGVNDLETIDPALAAEWHPTKNGSLKPSDVKPSSGKKVWWLCSNGHEWPAQIASRHANGRGCPVCSNQLIVPGINDLQTVNPEISAEWHPTKNGDLKPSNVAPASNTIAWWICFRGHDWSAPVSDRASGRGCPICSSEKKTSFPEQALFYYLSMCFKAINRYKEDRYELDVYLPEFKVGIEYDGMYYHASSVAAQRENRKEQYYSKKGIRIIRVKESDKNHLEGHTIFYSYDSAYKSLPWAIHTVFDLLSRSNACPKISLSEDRAKINKLYVQTEKENSIAAKYPDIAKEWDCEKNGIDATMVPFSSGKKAWWKCSKGHSWEATPNSRSRGLGCPYCSNHRAWPGYNDLLTTNPKLAQEWHPTKNGTLTPSDVTEGSNKRVWWICSKSHAWDAQINSRSRGNGCPYCSNQKLLVGYNDLMTTNPHLAREWHPTKNGDLKPENVIQGSKKKVWWICQEGHEWPARVYSRANDHGCPKCARIRSAIARQKQVLCIETGVIYDSATQAVKETGYSKIPSCVIGIRKTAGGLHWRYLD